MTTTNIHFIGGEKGGVGKSLMARVLAQYLIDKQLPFLGFDTDRSHGALMRFYPGLRLAGGGRQDRVARRDRRGRGRPARAAASWSTSPRRRTIRSPRWMEDAGVIGLADELGMKLFYWHVMDSGKDSVDLLRRLLDRFGTGLHYVLVRNQVRGTDFSGLEQSGEQARAIGMGAHVVSVKKLHEHVIQKIDSREQQLLEGQGVRQGLDRPRPDGPPARQDVAARRLPRDRRSRRLTPRRR